MKLQMLTHSRMAAFRACPRRHYLRYELGLTSDKKTPALRIGSAFHEVLDARAKGEDWPDGLDDMPEYEMAMVAAMVQVHAELQPPLPMLASELPFQLPLRNRRTGAASRLWEWAGVIDGIVELDSGALALVERKTTSLDISPGNDYWLRVMRDQQISQYVMAARLEGWDIRTVLYDVVRRPTHRPKLATPDEKRKYRKSDGALYAGQRDTDEPPEEYAARMADMMRADPDKWLQRIEIPRLQSELDATADDQWAVQRMIRKAQRGGEWPRNPGSCVMPWRCRFLNICDNTDLETVTPDGYERRTDLHPEVTRAYS